MSVAGLCSCPACDARVSARPIAVPDHEYGLAWKASYVECGECRSTFQVPMPRPDQLSAFYPAGYHSFGRTGMLTRMRFDMRIRRLQALSAAKGAVLDHGCGDGSFLVRAAEQIPECSFFGYEISDREEVVELVKGRVTLIRGSEADLLRLLPRCGLITMNHVIEHLPNPLETLSQLKERLLPNGILEGQTPAANSFEHRLFGNRWSGYHAPRHTVVFSAAGLNNLLKRAGFEVVRINGAFNPAGIAVSLCSMGADAELPSRIERKGVKWLFSLACAAPLCVLDSISSAPGIVNFSALRSGQ